MMKSKKIKYFLLFFLILFCARIAYKYSPRRIEFIGYYNKVWAHRVNSPEKLKASLKYFDGLELDIVYDAEKKVLDIVHPPVKSIDFSLNQYLDLIPKNNEPFLWLDIKNLSNENVIEIRDKILLLLKNNYFPIKNIIIESQKPELLSVFIDSGFQVLYYLPSGLAQKTPQELQYSINIINQNLLLDKNIAISSNYEDYEILIKYFPKKSKYLWKIDGITFRNYLQTRKILKDTTVKVVLSRYKSFKGNR